MSIIPDCEMYSYVFVETELIKMEAAKIYMSNRVKYIF